MQGRRDQRVRVLRALESASRQFRTRRELWPLRAPARPLVVDDIIARTIAGETGALDPATLRSRSLLHLSWEDGSTWEVWTISLESGIKLYCDSTHEESRVLASGRRDSEIDTDRLFLELLSESAGETFGIVMEGGPPSRVRSSIDDRPAIVNFFVSLFEVAGIEEDIRRSTGSAPSDGDFRSDVERWLRQTMR